MSETNTTVTTPDGTASTKQERTFTQDEVNAMVNKKYAEWASKTADYEDLKTKAAKFDELEEANKSELQKEKERADNLQNQLDELNKANSMQSMRSKVAEELKIPANLLTGDTEELCREQAKNILNFAQIGNGGAVKDGGEVTVSGGKKSTRDQQKTVTFGSLSFVVRKPGGFEAAERRGSGNRRLPYCKIEMSDLL